MVQIRVTSGIRRLQVQVLLSERKLGMAQLGERRNSLWPMISPVFLGFH
jgi:hypothetical protein